MYLMYGSWSEFEIDLTDLKAGFLKSSPKVTLHPRTIKKAASQYPYGVGQFTSNASPAHRGGITKTIAGTSSPAQNKATWICPICSFANPVPSNFDPTTANRNTPLPPCLACGIKPSFPHVLKAAISAASGRRSSPNPAASSPIDLSRPLHLALDERSPRRNDFLGSDTELYGQDALSTEVGIQCPRCTFLNHPSLHTCEICGVALRPPELPRSPTLGSASARSESPGPSLDNKANINDQEFASVRFSFRAGGEKTFHERLKGALTQKKWLLQSAPPIPAPVEDASTLGKFTSDSRGAKIGDRPTSVGIAGLERRALELRQKNEVVIGSAFSDLDALRASAKEIIALAESFATSSTSSAIFAGGSQDVSQIIAESAKALDMVTTKDMAGGRSGSSVYLSEMSRNLAEYLTDDARGILKSEGGIMSLIDLWAIYNRARSEGGVDAVSPMEFEKAAKLWEKLRLPVRLRQFKNGLLVVQQADRTDDKTIAQLLGWLQELHELPANSTDAVDGDRRKNDNWDSEGFGRGVTVQETAQRFGWSVGVASEELEMAEEKGALCREGDGATGIIRFWENWIVELEENSEYSGGLATGLEGQGRWAADNEENIIQNLKDSGLI